MTRSKAQSYSKHADSSLGRAANVLLCRVGPALPLSCSLPVSRSGVKTGRKVHATEIKHKGGREILKYFFLILHSVDRSIALASVSAAGA